MKWSGQNFNSTIVCLVGLFLICHSTTHAVTVRLQGGSNQCEGRLEVLSGSVFGSACDRSFSTEEAQVACRQLGCPLASSMRVDANNFGPRTNNILQAFGYDCSGTENSIEDCNLVGATCSPSDTIGVKCNATTTLSPQMVTVRLQGGSNQCEGRLEVLSGSVFGSACDRSFSTDEVKVVCRQLGCPSATSTRVNANNFGPRTNNILQAFGYDCSGTENSIEDCDLVGATCSPSDTIGVICNTTTTPLPQMAEGDLRLVGGTNRCEGRLQVSVVDLRSAVNSLQWSTTCDRDFSTEEIRTACRQLGCPTGDPSRQSISRFGGRPPSPHVYQAFGFTCSGQENKVVNCPYTGAVCDIRNGRIADIIGISCNDGDEPTTAATTQPPGGPAEGELRLAGGPNSCQGRLEVYIPFLGQWAQAVYRDFGPEEVQVACRELGCGDQGERISASSNSGPYQEVGYRCSGDEEMLEDCQPLAAFSRGTQHYIGLRCSAPQPACTHDILAAVTCTSFSRFCSLAILQELCCSTCGSL